MGFIESMNEGKFVKLCEINPPKGVDVKPMYETASLLKGRIDAFLVTDMQSAVMRMGGLTASFLLKQQGYEIVYNISCRDRNVLAIQSDLLGASALGIENIYITDGDDINLGDHPSAKPVNAVESFGVLKIVNKLQNGVDEGGNKLSEAPRYKIGAFVNTNAVDKDLDREIVLMEDKVKNNVAFFMTPPVFDIPSFEKFIKKAKHYYNVPIIAETIPLKSVATARFINKHVDNMHVPEAVIERLHSAGDKHAESIAITSEIIRGLKELCNGVNIIPLGWEEKVHSFLEAADV